MQSVRAIRTKNLGNHVETTLMAWSYRHFQRNATLHSV